MFKTTKRKPKQLEEVPALPKEMVYLTEWYWEVFDGEPLSYQKLHYWSLVMQRNIETWEVKALIDIDHVYWKVKGEERK